MPKYDFTTIIDRHGKDAFAVDAIGKLPGGAPDMPKEGFEPIPMWVADMGFATVPTIQQAIMERASHNLYGYYLEPDAYSESIIRWKETRNGVTGLTKECIGYENGVLGGVINALNTLCSRGDNVLVHAPTYIGFTHSLENAGYKIIHSYLKQDEAGIWRMDYEDMEKKIVEHQIHATIFCSPHNPTGRVWEREEIEKAMEIFEKHDVYVISDEIWSDIILAGHKHIPTQMINDTARNRTIALYAPSKTFNLAGLIGSYHIIYNKRLRDRVRKESSLCHYNNMNVLSMHALIGAYKPEGEEWVNELCDVLTENTSYACQFINEHFKGVQVSRPQGTYLLFLDCTEWCKAHHTTMDELIKAGWDVGVAWSDGRAFHGPCHIRMNVALPFTKVQEAMERLEKYVFCR